MTHLKMAIKTASSNQDLIRTIGRGVLILSSECLNGRIDTKLWLWSKANLPRLKEGMMTFSDSFSDKHSIKLDVDAMWTEFSNKCEELMADHVPSKFSSTRFSQPWINRNLKRLSRRKKRAYKKNRIDSDWNN